jgi:hypothetical protein
MPDNLCYTFQKRALCAEGLFQERKKMKIQGPSKSGETSKTDKAKKTGKTDSTFGNMVTGGARESAGAGASQSIARVDALLSVQAAEDPTERAARRRMKSRGESILNQLDRLKMSILTGNLTVGEVINIADVVASHREKVSDPGLTAILDEIDLRAQIEIAKIRKAMESRG